MKKELVIRQMNEGLFLKAEREDLELLQNADLEAHNSSRKKIKDWEVKSIREP